MPQIRPTTSLNPDDSVSIGLSRSERIAEIGEARETEINRVYREHLLNIVNMGIEIPQETREEARRREEREMGVPQSSTSTAPETRPERIPIHSVVRSYETNESYYVIGNGETPDTFEIAFFTNIFSLAGERQLSDRTGVEVNRDDFYLLFTTDGRSNLTREQIGLFLSESTPPQVDNPEQFEYIGRHPDRHDRANGSHPKKDVISEKDFLSE